MPFVFTASQRSQQDNEEDTRYRALAFRYLNYNARYQDDSNENTRSFRRRLQESRASLLQPLLQQEMDDMTSSDSSSDDDDDEEDDDDDDFEPEELEHDESSDSSSSSSSEDEEGPINNNSNTATAEPSSLSSSFSRSRVDIYRLAIRTNSEILEDLAAIIRILRQINALYRVFHNSNNNFTTGLLRFNRSGQQRYNHNDSDAVASTEEEEEEEEEASKILEAGLEDLQAVLSTESANIGNRKRQSTLALLALVTYQYSHCSDSYLRRYLDPNGEYDPTLAIFAAATYGDDDDDNDDEAIEPKSCRDIILAAEELYGPDWLDEFHKGKEGALRKMLEKLTFVAKIRLKVRDLNLLPVIR